MTDQLPPGYVDIRGKAYKTVAKRVAEFRESHTLAGGWGIVTEIMEISENRVLVKASVTGANGEVIATGHAEEERGVGNINKTSAVENCETSAIGRCLAACGYGGSDLDYASADEMMKAESLRVMLDEGKLSPVKAKKYVEGIRTALEKEDVHGINELMDELTNEQKAWIWRRFESWERSQMKRMQQALKEESNQPDPTYQDGGKT